MVGHLGDHLAGGDIERGVEVRGAVATIGVALPGRGAEQHRQHWCGPIECLDLGFFLIDAQHHHRLSGVVSNVATMTCSTMSSVILRGCPGRGSSINPSSRLSANRVRHLPTATRLHPSFLAISWLLNRSPRARSDTATPTPEQTSGGAPTARASRAPHRSARSVLLVVHAVPSVPPIVVDTDDNATPRKIPANQRLTTLDDSASCWPEVT